MKRGIGALVAVFGLVLLCIRVIYYLYHHRSYGDTTNQLEISQARFEAITKPSIGGSTRLVILICSAPSHRALRDAIRQTWGSCDGNSESDSPIGGGPRYSCRLLFYTSRTFVDEIDGPVFVEARRHGDLVICNGKDSYWNITQKKMCALAYLNETFAPDHDWFILKADDDVYVRTDAILALLPSFRKPVYAGMLLTGGAVSRDVTYRHYTPRSLYAPDKWPPYCKGAMYIMSSDTLPRLLTESHNMPYINSDDAYIGVLMERLGVVPIDIPEFVHIWLLSKYLFLFTDYVKNGMMGFSDAFTPNQIRWLHQIMRPCDNCLTELAPNVFYAYFYALCLCPLLCLGLPIGVGLRIWWQLLQAENVHTD